MPEQNRSSARWKKPLLITSLIASLALNGWLMSRSSSNITTPSSVAQLPDLDISERQELFFGQAGVLETSFRLNSKSNEETLSLTFNTPMIQQAAQNLLIFAQVGGQFSDEIFRLDCLIKLINFKSLFPSVSLLFSFTA